MTTRERTRARRNALYFEKRARVLLDEARNFKRLGLPGLARAHVVRSRKAWQQFLNYRRQAQEAREQH